VGFGYLATIHSGDPAARPGRPDATPRWEQATVWTVVAFTMFTGIAWIVAPSAFTDAVAGVVGTEATYAGQARGVADVAFALLVWSMRHRAGSTAGRAGGSSSCSTSDGRWASPLCGSVRDEPGADLLCADRGR
jgi:hypothetical protein